VILAGCIGRYPAREKIEPSEEDQFPKGTLMAQTASNPTGNSGRTVAAALFQALEASKPMANLWRMREEAQKLAAKMSQPLDMSLPEKMRLMSLQKRIAKLEEELGHVGLHSTGSCMSLTTVTTVQGSQSNRVRQRGWHSNHGNESAVDGSPQHAPVGHGVGSAMGGVGISFFTCDGAMGADASNMQDDMTSESASVRDDVSEVMRDSEFAVVSSCEHEFFEGEAFGQWAEGAPPAAGEASPMLGRPQVFRAHADSDVLVLTRGAYEKAMSEAKKTRLDTRTSFLRKWLPAQVHANLIDRLAPMFVEETRPRGFVIVRRGSLAELLWLVVDGTCHCAFAAASAASCACTRQTGAGVAEQPLGILQEGQFIGLVSALLQLPEPLTVSVASHSAKFLALKPDNILRVGGQLVEALSAVLSAQQDWHGHRCEDVAAVPAQVSQRLERVKHELQRSQIPLLIDSPFLRRRRGAVQQAGLANLEAVCYHYRGRVHPEAEWLSAPHNRTFFNSVRLAPNAAIATASLADLPGEAVGAYSDDDGAGHGDLVAAPATPSAALELPSVAASAFQPRGVAMAAASKFRKFEGLAHRSRDEARQQGGFEGRLEVGSRQCGQIGSSMPAKAPGPAASLATPRGTLPSMPASAVVSPTTATVATTAGPGPQAQAKSASAWPSALGPGDGQYVGSGSLGLPFPVKRAVKKTTLTPLSARGACERKATSVASTSRGGDDTADTQEQLTLKTSRVFRQTRVQVELQRRQAQNLRGWIGSLKVPPHTPWNHPVDAIEAIAADGDHETIDASSGPVRRRGGNSFRSQALQKRQQNKLETARRNWRQMPKTTDSSTSAGVAPAALEFQQLRPRDAPAPARELISDEPVLAESELPSDQVRSNRPRKVVPPDVLQTGITSACDVPRHTGQDASGASVGHFQHRLPSQDSDQQVAQGAHDPVASVDVSPGESAQHVSDVGVLGGAQDLRTAVALMSRQPPRASSMIPRNNTKSVSALDALDTSWDGLRSCGTDNALELSHTHDSPSAHAMSDNTSPHGGLPSAEEEGKSF